jgi:site-specific DNA-methyltransferase (adenine-specific)
MGLDGAKRPMEGIELLNLDCMEYMATLADKAFDLAIVDPPYGIGENARRSASRAKPFGSGNKTKYGSRLAATTDWGAFDKEWDRSCPSAEYFAELERVSKNQIIWGANHMMHVIKKSSPCWIVWDKDNSGCFADCELAYGSFKTAARIFKFRWNGMLQENMANKELRIHPTQKPVKLYEWLLSEYANPGDRILDTHLGSGSSAIAAFNLGFSFVGTEIDKNYLQAATERLEHHRRQLSLPLCDDYQKVTLGEFQDSFL